MSTSYFLPSSWSPWSPSLSTGAAPIDSLQRRLSRMFDDVFSGYELGAANGTAEKISAFAPKIAITEDEKRYKVTAELPGMSESDIDISLTKDGLTLRGEKKEEKESKENGAYYSERTYGSFMRQFPLLVEVDEDKVDASFSKGVLTISLPKAAAAQKQTKKISVRAS